MAVAEKIQEMVGVTPTYSHIEREKIRSEARRKATSKWFGLVLDHHLLIDNAFAAVKTATTTGARAMAQQKLAVILTGHSIAEEAIIYPLMKLKTSSMDANHAFTEQAEAKTEMVALDNIADKMSSEYESKLEDIRKAVEHHMVEEERDFFPELQDKADAATNDKISQHYQMEFHRYAGDAIDA